MNDIHDPQNHTVYFIKPVGMDGPIKIGCSRYPHAHRLNELMALCPFELEVAATIRGSFKLERNIHACFADLHLHHEWFRADKRLTDAIAQIAAGVPVEQAIDLTAKIGPITNVWRGGGKKKAAA